MLLPIFIGHKWHISELPLASFSRANESHFHANG